MIPLIFSLSFDSLLCAIALSTFIRGPFSVLAMSAAFGLCDGLGSLLAPAVGGAWPVVAECVVILYLVVYVIGQTPRLLAYGLPVVMSLDNLAAGSPATAYSDSLTSAAMALLGFCIGAVLFPSGMRRYAAAPVLIAAFLLH